MKSWSQDIRPSRTSRGRNEEMFTGIVEEVGRVTSLEPPQAPRNIATLTVEAGLVLDGMKLGDSVAINGACLTVVSLDSAGFQVEMVPETMRRTNLGHLAEGKLVNLERPLAVSDRLGGHIVQGHVDGTGTLVSMAPEGDSVIMGFEATQDLMPYIVGKGFIALDGASLTVVDKGTTSFTIAVIPYTLQNTIFRERQLGDVVNLEVDVVAKYVESLLDAKS